MSWDKVEELRWDEVWSVKSAVWSVGVKTAVWSVEYWESNEKCEVWTVQWEACSVKCEVWIGKSAVWSEKCGVWSVKCAVWIGKSAVWSEKCGVWSVKCAVWSVKKAVRSVKGEMELQMWHVKQDTTFAECTHARAWLAHGACKFYRWERSFIYIFKVTSAPPRAGTTGNRIVSILQISAIFPSIAIIFVCGILILSDIFPMFGRRGTFKNYNFEVPINSDEIFPGAFRCLILRQEDIGKKIIGKGFIQRN